MQNKHNSDCDRIITGTYKELKEALPGIRSSRVVHVTGEESLQEAIDIANDVDGILLDSGNQKLPVKELGGPGEDT